MEYTNKDNIIVFDQFESHLKLERGTHKKILEIAEGRGGLKKIFVNNFTKIIDIKFSKSCNENFLQIADLCAYYIYRQFVNYGYEWHNNSEKLPLYAFFNKIRFNFLCHPNSGKVSGVGLTCIPDIGKLNWNLFQKE